MTFTLSKIMIRTILRGSTIFSIRNHEFIFSFVVDNTTNPSLKLAPLVLTATVYYQLLWDAKVFLQGRRVSTAAFANCQWWQSCDDSVASNTRRLPCETTESHSLETEQWQRPLGPHWASHAFLGWKGVKQRLYNQLKTCSKLFSSWNKTPVFY